MKPILRVGHLNALQPKIVNCNESVLHLNELLFFCLCNPHIYIIYIIIDTAFLLYYKNTV